MCCLLQNKRKEREKKREREIEREGDHPTSSKTAGCFSTGRLSMAIGWPLLSRSNALLRKSFLVVDFRNHYRLNNRTHRVLLNEEVQLTSGLFITCFIYLRDNFFMFILVVPALSKIILYVTADIQSGFLAFLELICMIIK